MQHCSQKEWLPREKRGSLTAGQDSFLPLPTKNLLRMILMMLMSTMCVVMALFPMLIVPMLLLWLVIPCTVAPLVPVFWRSGLEEAGEVVVLCAAPRRFELAFSGRSRLSRPEKDSSRLLFFTALPYDTLSFWAFSKDGVLPLLTLANA